MIDNILTNSISPPAVSTTAKSRSRVSNGDEARDDFAEVLKTKEKEQPKTDDSAAAAAASQMQQQKPADNSQAEDKPTDDGSSQPEYAASTVSRGALQPSIQVPIPADLANQAAALAAVPAALPATPAGVDQAGAAPAGDAQQTAAAAVAAAAVQPAPDAAASKDGQQQVVALDNKQNFEDVLKTAAGAQKSSVDPAAAAQTAAVQATQTAAPTAPQTAKLAEDTASALKPAAARTDEKAQASNLTDAPRPVEAGVITAQNPLQETAHAAAAAVKQPALPLDSQPLTVVQQMMNHLEASIQQGRGSIHMQLNPQDLGAIDIHLVSSAQGVSVNVFAEQASTGRLLETQMNQLRQALTDAGVQLSNLNVSQHGQPNQQNQQGSTFNRSPQYGHPAGGESSNPDEPRQGRSRSLLSGVDYLI